MRIWNVAVGRPEVKQSWNRRGEGGQGGWAQGGKGAGEQGGRFLCAVTYVLFCSRVRRSHGEGLFIMFTSLPRILS
jgi:hypothetical protein